MSRGSPARGEIVRRAVVIEAPGVRPKAMDAFLFGVPPSFATSARKIPSVEEMTLVSVAYITGGTLLAAATRGSDSGRANAPERTTGSSSGPPPPPPPPGGDPSRRAQRVEEIGGAQGRGVGEERVGVIGRPPVLRRPPVR